MASKLFRLLSSDLPSFAGTQVRHGHRLRGRPPTSARTLKQRLESLEKQDPEISFKVDIGLPVPFARNRAPWLLAQKQRRSDAKLEKMARKRELIIDLEQAHDIWFNTNGPKDMKNIADHYGIFQDLFGDAYFLPTVNLEVGYPLDNVTFAKVHRGNVIKPEEAQKTPIVGYTAKENSLWTLLMTTPDGNMENENDEYCHWFIGNIPGSFVERGEQIIDYLRPIPPRGIGYFRYIFVLYKQEKVLDYQEYKKLQPCLRLKERNWNTLEFYRKFQDYLTPAGLAFFQADWDPSVKEFYHRTLDAQEPICQYDFPKPYVRPQEWFPKKRAFNTYLDRYMDPKDVAKRYVLKKLANVHPFRKPDPPLKYPNAHPYPADAPSWLRVEMKKDRLGWGRINDI